MKVRVKRHHDSPIFPASYQDLRVSRGCEPKLAHVNCIEILISEDSTADRGRPWSRRNLIRRA